MSSTANPLYALLASSMSTPLNLSSPIGTGRAGQTHRSRRRLLLLLELLAEGEGLIAVAGAAEGRREGHGERNAGLTLPLELLPLLADRADRELNFARGRDSDRTGDVHACPGVTQLTGIGHGHRDRRRSLLLVAGDGTEGDRVGWLDRRLD